MSITALSVLKSHLRVTHSDEDALIQLYLDAAEGAVANRVQRVLIAEGATPAPDSDQLPMSWDVRAAVLMFAAHLYEHREVVTEESVVVLPMSLDFLLAPYRVWAPETVTVAV
jgi:uncharacterized phage protein (predicted DNA packaging)